MAFEKLIMAFGQRIHPRGADQNNAVRTACVGA